MTADPQLIREAVLQAIERHRPLCIRGSGSKDFYAERVQGEPLALHEFTGIIDYEPGELVLTARSGTSLAELESLLATHGQMLAFEPPRFGGGTLGGCVASGLSGPRRPHTGAVRDFVLGVRIVDGKANDLRFGGQVIKNVAGYDVSRLMVGALGTLGVLLEISLKVLPRPAVERTLRFQLDEASALDFVNRWAGQPLPISATCHEDNSLSVRLSGCEVAVAAAQRRMGGEWLVEADEYWRSIRDQSAGFFRAVDPLWRVCVPATAPPLKSNLPQLIEWGGGLRWLSGHAEADELRRQATALGGHVIVFRNRPPNVQVFHPLSPAVYEIHRGLQREFDPHGIFNPGRMYQY